MMVGRDLGVELCREVDTALRNLLLVVNLDGAATEEFALLIPEQPLCGGIDACDEAGVVGDDDAEGRTVDDRLVKVESSLQLFFLLEVTRDVGDRSEDAVGQFDDLNAIAAGSISGLEGLAGDFKQCGFSCFDNPFVLLEVIGMAQGEKELGEISAEHVIAAHAEDSLGVAIEKDELEVADFSVGVANAVIHADGI